MSRIGISVCRVMIPAGLTVLFAASIAAKMPLTAPTGREVYMNRCGACHGESGDGNGPAVGSLVIAPGDLTTLAKRNGGSFPTERVKRIVGEWIQITAHGSREMPVWGDLFHPRTAADQQTANERFKSLVSFLESIQQ